MASPFVVRYLPANRAYAVMFGESILRIFNDEWEAYEELKDWGVPLTPEQDRIRRGGTPRRRKRRNPEGNPTDDLDRVGLVTSIEYIRRGEPGVVYVHKFKRKPVASYNPKRRELIIRPVNAEPV